MSKSYVSTALRQLVRARAKRVCEYCLIHEEDTYFGCQVQADHIIFCLICVSSFNFGICSRSLRIGLMF